MNRHLSWVYRFIEVVYSLIETGLRN